MNQKEREYRWSIKDITKETKTQGRYIYDVYTITYESGEQEKTRLYPLLERLNLSYENFQFRQHQTDKTLMEALLTPARTKKGTPIRRAKHRKREGNTYEYKWDEERDLKRRQKMKDLKKEREEKKTT